LVFFARIYFILAILLVGVIQLLTLGGCGIWVLIDFIMLLLGNFKDAEGNTIKVM
jgi:hypothetical protein